MSAIFSVVSSEFSPHSTTHFCTAISTYADIPLCVTSKVPGVQGLLSPRNTLVSVAMQAVGLAMAGNRVSTHSMAEGLAYVPAGEDDHPCIILAGDVTQEGAEVVRNLLSAGRQPFTEVLYLTMDDGEVHVCFYLYYTVQSIKGWGSRTR
jgi:hypothetical protein